MSLVSLYCPVSRFSETCPFDVSTPKERNKKTRNIEDKRVSQLQEIRLVFWGGLYIYIYIYKYRQYDLLERWEWRLFGKVHGCGS